MRRGSRRSQVIGLTAGGILLALSGCAVVPRSQMEQSQKTDRMLRTQLAESREELAKLKKRNRDLLAQSSGGDRRLAALEEANQRYERDIAAYQDERDQYAQVLDQIKSQILASSSSTHKAVQTEPSWTRFLASYPGSRFEPTTGQLTLGINEFFQDDSATFRPDARSDLVEFARSLRQTAGHPLTSARLLLPPDDGEIRLVSHSDTKPINPTQNRAKQILDALESGGVNAEIQNEKSTRVNFRNSAIILDLGSRWMTRDPS